MIIARRTRLERSESATGFEQVEHGGRQDLYTVYRPTTKITRDLSSRGDKLRHSYLRAPGKYVSVDKPINRVKDECNLVSPRCFDRDLDWSRERPPIIESESVTPVTRVPVKNCHDCFTDAIHEPNYSPFSFSQVVSSNNTCTSTEYISAWNGIRRVGAVDKSACRANRDRTTRKTIRVAAARAVRVNVRLDAIEIPRETSSFPLVLRLANYNKI